MRSAGAARATFAFLIGCIAGCSSTAPGPSNESVSSDAASTDASTSDVGESADAARDEPTSVALTDDERRTLLGLSPEMLPRPPADATNRLANDAAAALLGKKLFFETGFSGPLLDSDNDGTGGSLGLRGETGKVACASCHIPHDGFSDTRSFQRQISLGAGWGRRRAPSLLDVGQTRLVMWDGRRDALYNQVFGPIESVVEMNSSRLFVAERMFAIHRADYEAVFGAMPALDDPNRFPQLAAELTGCQPKAPSNPQPRCDGTFHGMPGDQAEFDGLPEDDRVAVTTVVANMGKAIAAYERLLSCGSGAFDRWVHGDETAISESAKRGARLFVGKGECASCHSGPFLSDQKFHNVGLEPKLVQQAFVDSDDHGAATGLAAAIADPLNSLGRFSDGHDDRLPTSVGLELEGAFRTPMLRCVSQRPAFMHTGQLPTLSKVVAMFDAGGYGSGFVGQSEIHNLGLSAGEQADLVEFLKTLDGPGAAADLLEP